MTVVTYEAPANGSALPALLEVCRDCETRPVPHDGNGTEYCRVYEGAHSGQCQHPEHDDSTCPDCGGGLQGCTGCDHHGYPCTCSSA